MLKRKSEGQTFGGAIVDCFSLLKRTWLPNSLVVLIGIITSLIIMLVLGLGSFRNIEQLAVAQQHAAQTTGALQLHFLLSHAGNMKPLILFFVSVLLVMWVFKIMNAILVRASWNMAESGSTHLRNAFKIGLKYCWVYLLLMIVMLALMAAAFFVQWVVSLVDLYFLNVIVTILTQLVVYFVALKLFLVEAASVIDECGIQGFGHAWRATSQNWWFTLGVIVFANVFYVVALYMVGLGVFWAVFGPAINPLFATIVMQHLPQWLIVLFSVASAVTLLALIFTVPSMFASTQTVVYSALTQSTPSADKAKKRR